MELPDGTRDVVDPEVRAYVSSLVTAVSLNHTYRFCVANLPQSSVAAVEMKKEDMYLEMMPWLA